MHFSISSPFVCSNAAKETLEECLRCRKADRFRVGMQMSAFVTGRMICEALKDGPLSKTAVPGGLPRPVHYGTALLVCHLKPALKLGLRK